MRPDGHQEVHVVDDPVPSTTNTWISPVTNITYHNEFRLGISSLDLKLDIKRPIRGAGEMSFFAKPSTTTTLFEVPIEFTGTLNGKSVSGFGLSEQWNPGVQAG